MMHDRRFGERVGSRDGAHQCIPHPRTAYAPMEAEAAPADFYTLGSRQCPRLQIVAVERALRGVKPAIPLIDTAAVFKQPAKE